MQECIRGFESLSLRQKIPRVFTLGIFCCTECKAGFEGGGASGSERFEGELHDNGNVRRKLQQPSGLCTGARRQRRESLTFRQ